jgi:enhancing lycopene biosynthesis protein 2
LQSEDDAIVSGDFNGNGRDDLAINNSRLGQIWVALSRGDGTLDPPSLVRMGIFGAALAAADFNGDGDEDLVAADTVSSSDQGHQSQTGFVRLFPGMGDETFGPPVTTGVGKKPVSLAVADLDQDGKLDLAVANYFSGSISVLRGSRVKLVAGD